MKIVEWMENLFDTVAATTPSRELEVALEKEVDFSIKNRKRPYSVSILRTALAGEHHEATLYAMWYLIEVGGNGWSDSRCKALRDFMEREIDKYENLHKRIPVPPSEDVNA